MRCGSGLLAHACKALTGRRLGEEALPAESPPASFTHPEGPPSEATQCGVDLRDLLVDLPSRTACPLCVEQGLAKGEEAKLDAVIEG